MFLSWIPFYTNFPLKRLRERQNFLWRAVIIIILLSAAQVVLLLSYVLHFRSGNFIPFPGKNILNEGNIQLIKYFDNNVFTWKQRILVLAEREISKEVSEIISIFEASRINYSIIFSPQNISSIKGIRDGHFRVIVVENFTFYNKMNHRNKKLLHEYCLDHAIGLIIFVYSVEKISIPKGNMLNLSVLHNGIYDYETVSNSNVLHLTQGGMIDRSTIPGEKWITFLGNHQTYEPITFARAHPGNNKVVLVLEDKGYLDGVRKVFFGNSLNYWLHILLFLDAVSYLSKGYFMFPLERYLLIDIDDIFVGKTGIRMKSNDVKASISYTSTQYYRQYKCA